jgi:hypothetical protein
MDWWVSVINLGPYIMHVAYNMDGHVVVEEGKLDWC